jgi:hypothetical protein
MGTAVNAERRPAVERPAQRQPVSLERAERDSDRLTYRRAPRVLVRHRNAVTIAREPLAAGGLVAQRARRRQVVVGRLLVIARGHVLARCARAGFGAGKRCQPTRPPTLAGWLLLTEADDVALVCVPAHQRLECLAGHRMRRRTRRRGSALVARSTCARRRPRRRMTVPSLRQQRPWTRSAGSRRAAGRQGATVSSGHRHQLPAANTGSCRVETARAASLGVVAAGVRGAIGQDGGRPRPVAEVAHGLRRPRKTQKDPGPLRHGSASPTWAVEG